jgi:hypothetical protein
MVVAAQGDADRDQNPAGGAAQGGRRWTETAAASRPLQLDSPEFVEAIQDEGISVDHGLDALLRSGSARVAAGRAVRRLVTIISRYGGNGIV